MSRVKIEVTQQDIDRGRRVDCLRCPIALAAKRVCGTRKRIDVTSHYIFGLSSKTAELTGVWLSTRAQAFIRRFDDGLPVAPFTFEVEL